MDTRAHVVNGVERFKFIYIEKPWHYDKVAAIAVAKLFNIAHHSDASEYTAIYLYVQSIHQLP